MMRTVNLKSTIFAGRRPGWLFALAFIFMVIGYTRLSTGQTTQPHASQPKMFASPAEAAAALFQAVRNEDE